MIFFKSTIFSKKINKEISFLIRYDKISKETFISGKINGTNSYINQTIGGYQQLFFTKKILTETFLLLIKQLENHHLQNKKI